MKKLLIFYEKYKWTLAFLTGILAALIYCLAYFVLGSKSYVQITDQLDGEVVNYIYCAKYLFTGQRQVAEFMNGMDISAMTPPAPLGVLFYKLLPPFVAFAAMHIFEVFVGYIGMFLLGRLVSKNPLVVLVTSCLFIYLPFYPVYGLSVLGQPVLLWALVQIYQSKPFKLRYYLCIVLYGVASSLALVGFAWLGLLGVAVVGTGLWHKSITRTQTGKRNTIKREKALQKELVKTEEYIEHKESAQSREYVERKESTKTKIQDTGCVRLMLAFVVLLFSYMLCNINLVQGFFGGGANYSFHREEMVIDAMPDWGAYLKEIFLEGGTYVKAYNGFIVAFAVAVIVCKLLWCGVYKKKISNKCKLLCGLLGLSFVIAFVACCWRLPVIVDWRMEMGGVFKYFQADRIYWLLPLCWYLIFMIALEIFMGLEGRAGVRIVCCGISLVAMLVMCNIVYENSPIYHNLRLMIFPKTYHLMTWEDYYAEEVYAQIEGYIQENTGEEQSEYRVLSLGINPAAALYNGFYCLDGYSNLYSLDYKHEFRKIIEKELDKSGETKVYFDTWGNRCYLLNSETGNYMTISRGSGSYRNLELNTMQMKSMGGKYLFSAMPIDNALDMGLSLLRATPFSTEDSYYEIWVYEIL